MNRTDIAAKLEEVEGSGRLDLSGTALSAGDLVMIAEAITGMEDKIQQLSMAGCHLTEFPAFIMHCNALRMLWLYSNDIQLVPDMWQQLPELMVFDMSDNPVTELPGIEQSTVQRLYLNNAGVTHVPPGWKQLESLEILEMEQRQFGDGNMGIENLPASLRELKITHGLLGSSLSFAHLPGLESLVLPQNGFTSLADDTESLLQLAMLDVSGNMLQVLPADIGALPALVYLDVSSNMLETLPESTGLLPLQTAFFQNNKLRELPTDVTGWDNMSMLDFSNNALDDLPDYTSCLPLLDTIDCSGNNFTEIPAWLERSATLRKLLFARNPIKELPLWLGKKERKLDVSETQLDAAAVNALVAHGIDNDLELTITGTPAATEQTAITGHLKLHLVI